MALNQGDKRSAGEGLNLTFSRDRRSADRESMGRAWMLEHATPAVLEVRDVQLDFAGHRVVGPLGPKPLSPTELNLLATLMGNVGTVVPFESLIAAAWEDASPHPKELAVYMRRLRMKIEPDPSKPVYIRSVKQFGYVFDHS